jgi:hypothetical protein
MTKDASVPYTAAATIVTRMGGDAMRLRRAQRDRA